MSDGLIVRTGRGGLAIIGCLIGMAGAGVQAQEAGGLIISTLPGDVVIGAQAAPAAQPETVTAVSLQPQTPAGTDTLTATDGNSSATRRAGLPKPSIIVGDMAILAAIGPRGPLGLPFPLREAIRQRDAALFDRLLGRGVFDPDLDRLAEAIQTELKRTECYSGAIDGDWGAGSTRAADRWKTAAGSTVETTPQVQLFRAIAKTGEMTCPPVAAPAVASSSSRGNASTASASRGNNTRGNRNPTTAQAQPSRREPQRQPEPAKPQISRPQNGFNPSLLGSGVWR